MLCSSGVLLLVLTAVYYNCCAGTYGVIASNTCLTCGTCAAGLTVTTACSGLTNTVCQGGARGGAR